MSYTFPLIGISQKIAIFRVMRKMLIEKYGNKQYLPPYGYPPINEGKDISPIKEPEVYDLPKRWVN